MCTRDARVLATWVEFWLLVFHSWARIFDMFFIDRCLSNKLPIGIACQPSRDPFITHSHSISAHPLRTFTNLWKLSNIDFCHYYWPLRTNKECGLSRNAIIWTLSLCSTRFMPHKSSRIELGQVWRKVVERFDFRFK